MRDNDYPQASVLPRRLPPALLLLGALAVAAPGTAQVTVEEINPTNSTLDPSDADGATGGRVNGIAAVPGDNQTFYAASEWGGVFKSSDGGNTWARLDGHLPVVTWDVAVDPANVNRVYATSFYDGRVASRSGISVSSDAGVTWTRPASAVPPSTFNCSSQRRTEPSAFGIAIDPDTPSHVYVGTNCGLAISTDSGGSWSFVDPTPGDAADNVWDVVVHDGGIIDLCGDDGHLRSTNGGASFTAGSGLPSGTCSIAVSPDESYVLFAVVGTRIFESDDGGATWPTEFANPSPQGRIPFVATNQRANGGGGENLFDLWFGDVRLHRASCTTPASPAPGGSARCPASGSWAGPYTRSAGAHDDSGDIAFDSQAAVDACPRLFSSDGGVYYNTRTTSPGCHAPAWEQPSVTPRGLWPFGMTGANQAGDVQEDVYFGNQDNGTFAATDAGSVSPSWQNRDCCDGFDTAADPARVLYTLCCFSPGRANRLFRRGPGMSGGGEVPNYPAGNLPAFRPIDIIDEYGNDDYVLVTTAGVFLTENVGATPITWTQLGVATSPANACGVQAAVDSGTPTFYVQAGICNERNMGNQGDQLWRFVGTNPAGTWQRVDTGLTGGIGIFAVDPNDPDRLYASNVRPVAQGGPQMVFSTNGGTTWQNDAVLDMLMTGNGVFRYRSERGPSNFTGFNGYPQPTLVAFDDEDPNILVAGGRDSGVFLSTDRGEEWRLVTDPVDPVGSGVPHIPRPWFAYFDHEPSNRVNVYVGSQGRGVWRLSFFRPPVADADGPYTTPEGTDVGLDATASSDADGPISYAWDLDNDGLFDDSTSATPLFTEVGQDGLYPVAVRVTDSDGAEDTDGSSVTVTNVAPTVVFGVAPQPQNEGSPILLTGSATDPGWLDPLTAGVAWGDGVSEPLPGSIENVRPDATLSFGGNHTYLDNLPGNAPYTAQVCVADDDTSTCVSQPVTILNVAPTVTAAPDQVIFEDDTLGITLASFTDPGVLDTHTASIDWGDGSPPEPGTVTEAAGSGSVSASHVYPTPGIHTVTVTVTDKDGGIGSDTLKVTVVHGFLRYCLFGERPGSLDAVTARQSAVLECGAGSDAQGVGGNGMLGFQPEVQLQGKAVSVGAGVGAQPRVEIEGDVDAAGDVSLGTLASVTGDVRSRGDVSLGNRASVGGDVAANGSVSLGNGATVGGSVTEAAGLTAIPDISWVSVSFAPGPGSILVRKGQTLALPPGAYATLTVQSGGTLRLSAGSYVFRSFDVGPKSRLDFDFTGGPVTVDVDGDLDFQPDVTMAAISAGGPNDLMFRVAGSVRLGQGGRYFGTFLAPSGDIVMNTDARLDGALYGRTVDVHARSTTHGDPALELFVSLFLMP